jgi:murein L,D-transpeptidase YcbB/YkuD
MLKTNDHAAGQKPMHRMGSRRAPAAARRAWATVLGRGLLAAACALAGGAPALEAAAEPVPPRLPAEPPGPPPPAVAAAVERVLSSAEHPGLTWSRIPDVAPVLAEIYRSEPDGLFWFAGNTPYPVLEEAIAELTSAGAHGLDPADYDAKRLADEWATLKSGARSATDRALFDLGLSVAVVRLLSAVHLGRVDPATMDWGYDLAPKQLDIAATLRDVRNGQGVTAAVAALEPPFAHYARARRTLSTYRSAIEPPPVPALPEGQKKVEPEEPWTGVPALAARLRAFGDLAGQDDAAFAPDGTPLYTGALVAATRRFQGRHALEQDGVIGPGTLAALNVTFAERVRQIELAMERMRWLPKMGDRPSVFVNVPLFRLWATDPLTGDEPLRMNVVVGKSMNHQTPMFVEQMEYVIFRPYWNPPHGIAVNEIVPHARRDPAYIDRQSFEIVASGDDAASALPATNENLDKVAAGRLHIRQKPGPNNALGLAKFIFPNANNVYMHGTPAQELFSRVRRDFSHGCIRLEDPPRLAEWVLRDQPEWTRERIDTAMQGERPTRVNLTAPLMVVLFYDTVHVNSEGVVYFVGDIYGHDAALDRALRRGYPYSGR